MPHVLGDFLQIATPTVVLPPGSPRVQSAQPQHVTRSRQDLVRGMRLHGTMNVALAISHGRMAPCFAGVELRIVDGNGDLNAAGLVSTRGWHPLGWGRELMRRDVGLLLCTGIDQGTWGSIRGHGIQVIPNAMGDPGATLAAWRSGRLRPPPIWPAYPAGSGGGRRRKRFRGGRW